MNRTAPLILCVLTVMGGCTSDQKSEPAPLSITDRTGRTIVYLKDFSLQARMVGLGEKMPDGKMHPLGMTSVEWYGSPPALVRPSSATLTSNDGVQALYRCPDGLILGSWENIEFLYDPITQAFEGPMGLYDYSPFVCIDIDDALDSRDVTAWEKALKNPTGEVYLKPESIRKAYHHPNPAAQKLAEKWIELAD